MALSDELQTDSGRARKEANAASVGRNGAASGRGGSPRGAAVGFWIDVENAANNG